MATKSSILEQLDAQIEHLFSPWNLWSTLLVLALIFGAVYTFLSARDPDTHPLLLSRQASVGAVRQSGESALYRSIETPHGLPLRKGLDIKEEGASKWSAGKDGDLRDLWSSLNLATSPWTKFETILGREKVEKHTGKELTRQMIIIGAHVKRKGCSRVAIYLPNSVELLITVFAAAFYDSEPVLIPYGQSEDVLLQLLQETGADFVIASAGALPLASINARCKKVKEVIWVVEKTSRHLDFEDDDDDLSTLSWHDLVAEHAASTSSDTPGTPTDRTIPDILTVWFKPGSPSHDVVAFTQKNIVAAVAAQVNALPVTHRLTQYDVFMPADSLAKHYVLVQTLAAMHSGSTIALNSVAGEDVDLSLACAGATPTVIAASARSLQKLYKETASTVTSSAKKLVLRSQTQALKAGYMPPATLLSGISSPTRATLGNLPNKLRLVYAYERSDAIGASLSPAALAELRAFTGARLIHALAAPTVAGAVTQTLFYDYRSGAQLHEQHAHFGPPVSSVELKVVDTDSHKTVGNDNPRGQIIVNGPAVAEGETKLDATAMIHQDGTLALI